MEFLKAIPTGTLLFNLVLYVCLPLWLIFGFLDWYCHKKSKIESTTGAKESFYHALMGVQVGLPVFLGLCFEINCLQFIIIFLILIAHEVVAHLDVQYALHKREISILEVHVHSFLETLPFVIVALIIIINWSAFVDFISFNWAGHMDLVWKQRPLDSKYVFGYFFTLIFLDVIPFVEEFIRCYRYKHSNSSEAQISE